MSTNDSFIKQWSTTPANNGTAPNTTPYGWPEGMPPSSVNDCARQNMTDHRYQWQDAEWFCWGDTVSKASGTVFKVATDVTARYQVDRRVKIFDTSTKYAVITASSYSAPDTSVTLRFDGDTSLGASVSAVALAIISAQSTSLPPQAFKNRNMIIGGNFDTNPWQRGTTFTSHASGTYHADRFFSTYAGAVVYDILRTADAPTVAQSGIYTTNCLHLDVTTADAAIAAGDYCFINQCVEGYNYAQIANRPFTLSFWVKATKIGTYCVAFRSSTGDRSYVAEYTINTTDTWEFKTITVSSAPSGGTWDYTNGTGVYVTWTLAGGSTYQTTAGAWQTGNYFSTSNQVNGVDSTSNNFKLALIQLEQGAVATPYELENAQQVLAKCQRYFFKTFDQGTTPATATSVYNGSIVFTNSVAGTGTYTVNVPFPVSMRKVNQTVTFYNVISANAKWYNANVAADSGSATLAAYGCNNIIISDAKVAGDTAQTGIYIHLTAQAELN